MVVLDPDPVILKVANTWLILNEGGGPTDDKPTVTLTTPANPDRTSAFLPRFCNPDGAANCADLQESIPLAHE